MGIQDTSTKDYLRDADIFADAVNYYLYGGETVVKPDSLKPLDSNLLLHIFGQEDMEQRNSQKGTEQTVVRYRDVVRQWNVMADENCAYAIFGIEAQTKTHYAMPVKCIVYDAMQYDYQVEELQAKHRNAKDLKSSAEFLSGMHKDDRLVPVITICIHFGTEPWDGALSLRELLDLRDERLLPYIQDYRVLLIEPDRMCEEDFAKFSTNLGAVLQFMKAAQDKKKLRELVTGNEVFQRLDLKAARVIRDCANVKIDIETSEEVVNVCKGWEDAIEDAREEERQAAQEREKKLCKGWEDAIEDARKEARLEERTAAQEREKQVRLEERESAKSLIISDAIGIYREMNVPETEILQRIMLRYTLTERAANTYLLSSGV